MRLVFAVASFIITISTLTLLQSDSSVKSATRPNSLIADIEAPKKQDAPTITSQFKQKISANLITALPTPTPVVSTIVTQEIFAPSPTSTSTPQILQTPIIQTIAPITPLTTAFETRKPSPTPTQATALATNTSHVYYTSSHWKSKYYYCDTDNDWKTLSATYLKSFSSPEALLQAFPSRILHEACK